MGSRGYASVELPGQLAERQGVWIEWHRTLPGPFPGCIYGEH